METLLNVLNRAGGLAILARQLHQSRRGVADNLSVQFSAIEAAHVSIQILLVEVGDVLVLVLAHNNQVAFTAKVTFDIQLGLQEVQNVLRFTLNLLADRVEVDPGGLGGGELARAGILTFLVFLFLLVIVFGRLVHDVLNSLEQIAVLVNLVTLHFVQVKLHYQANTSILRILAIWSSYIEL